MCDLRHINIVALYGVVTSVPGKFLLVMEYCSGGSLHDRLMGDGPIAEVTMPSRSLNLIVSTIVAPFSASAPMNPETK